MRHAKKVVTALLALLAVAGLAACGSSSDSKSSEKVSGALEPVPSAPSGYADVAGEATLDRSGGGTTVSLTATGLKPDAKYMAHLHTGGCEGPDPGGPHFKFDPSGSDEPPNEIHLEFSSDAGGDGSAKASSDREVPVGEAGSVVLHSADEHTMVAFVHGGHEHGEEGAAPSDKIACADLEGGEIAAEPTIVVRDGEPVGGIKELEYSAGDEIRFRVESDVADEVHVHGYDVMKDVAAGGTVAFDIPAEIEGIFEVELEGRKEQIAELRVNP